MKLNVESIKQRLHRLDQYIAELEKQRQASLQTFRRDFTQQLAVERAFQAAVESCTDIAAHIVSAYHLGHPQESRDVYRFLVQAGYLDAEFGEAMVTLVALRNRLVHLYWELDVERLYRYLQEDLPLLYRFRDLVLQILTIETESGQDEAHG